MIFHFSSFPFNAFNGGSIGPFTIEAEDKETAVRLAIQKIGQRSTDVRYTKHGCITDNYNNIWTISDGTYKTKFLDGSPIPDGYLEFISKMAEVADYITEDDELRMS